MQRQDIIQFFGISGQSVVIFLNVNKPGEYGSPELVGTHQKARDYEKFAWNKLDSQFPTQNIDLPISSKVLTANFQNFYQQIIYSPEAFLLMFYSTKKRFIEGDLVESIKMLNDVAEELDGQARVAVLNVDDERNKRFASAYGAWPLPSIMYLPKYSKDEEFTVQYEGAKNVSEIVHWVLDKKEEDANNYQIVLHQQDFQWQVQDSQDPWFIMFYTNDKNWCKKCEYIFPEWKKVAEKLNGQIKVGRFNCDYGRQICFQKFNVQRFPMFFYFPPGQKTDKNFQDYGEKVLISSDMAQWAQDRLAISKAKIVDHLTDQQIFDRYCTNLNGNASRL